MKTVLYFFVFCFFVSNAIAQKPITIYPFTTESKSGTYKIADTTTLYQVLKSCPDRAYGTAKQISTVQMQLPSLNGGFEFYNVFKTHVLKPVLAAKYPYIQTFFAQSVNDESQLAYIIFSPAICDITFVNYNGYSTLRKDNISQEFKELPFAATYESDFKCGSPNPISTNREISNLITGHVQNCTIYEPITAAFSCSVKFSEAAAADLNLGVSVATSLQKITQIVNNEINPLYLKEVALLFVLAEDEDDVIFTTTDDFVPNNIPASIVENNTICNNVIQDPDYQMGFLLHASDSYSVFEGTLGLSQLAGLCSNTRGKNGGFYYKSEPATTSIPYYQFKRLNTILHEIGHFLGATHTFNYTGCSNGNSETSVEPYGGYSLMGYGQDKVCWASDLNDQSLTGLGYGFQIPWPNSNFNSTSLHFNSISLKQIYNHLTNAGCVTGTLMNCSDLDAIANTASSIIIPKGTSFMLRGNKNPIDNNTYYQFDQVDDGIISTWPSNTYDPNIPLTPSYRATKNPLRFFRGPLRGDSNQMISDVTREMNFNYLKRRIIGGVGFTDINYKKVIVDNAGPLKINMVNNNTDEESWIPLYKFNEPCHISWDVNYTNTLDNGKLLDIYLIRGIKLLEQPSFSNEIDSTDFILVAKNILNTGNFYGELFFDPRIVAGSYTIVLMSQDKTFFTFSKGGFDIQPQLVFPVGGETIMQGDIYNKAYYISDPSFKAEPNGSIQVKIYLEKDGMGYNLINTNNSINDALDSIPLPTGQDDVSNQCKVSVEFLNTNTNDLMILQSSDFFKIIDTIPNLNIAINNFTTLDNLNGSHLIPFIDGILDTISFVKTKLDKESPVPEVNHSSYPGQICELGVFKRAKRPKGYSIVTEGNNSTVTNMTHLNTNFLHRRITSPFSLSYQVGSSFSNSNSVTFEYCNLALHGPCPEYGYQGAVSNCFASMGCWRLENGFLYPDTSYYFCNPGIYNTTLSLNNYIDYLFANTPPANTETFVNFSKVVPSRQPVLLAPNGFEKIEENGYIVVCWANPFFEPDPSNYVNIYLSGDNGNNYSLLASGVPSSEIINRYKVQPQAPLLPGSQYKIKVEITKSGSRSSSMFLELNDVSDSPFSVIADVKALSFSGLGESYCNTDGPVTLTGSPAGGVFSGPGISGDTFDPANITPGTHTIAYSYTHPSGFINNSYQQVTINNCSQAVVLDLKLFLEGFYSDINTMRPNLFDLGLSSEATETDMITVSLWSTESLLNPAPDHSITAVLHTNGTATLQFPAAVNGNSYYIAVKHRNHMETWSKLPVMFTSTTSYDFSDDLQKAFDDGVNPPMANMGSGVFAFYGGDVNQDGGIDASDLADIDNDNTIFAFGYNVTDVNGDGATDASDLAIVDNNSQLFLFYARPF